MEFEPLHSQQQCEMIIEESENDESSPMTSPNRQSQATTRQRWPTNNNDENDSNDNPHTNVVTDNDDDDYDSDDVDEFDESIGWRDMTPRMRKASITRQSLRGKPFMYPVGDSLNHLSDGEDDGDGDGGGKSVGGGEEGDDNSMKDVDMMDDDNFMMNSKMNDSADVIIDDDDDDDDKNDDPFSFCGPTGSSNDDNNGMNLEPGIASASADYDDPFGDMGIQQQASVAAPLGGELNNPLMSTMPSMDHDNMNPSMSMPFGGGIGYDNPFGGGLGSATNTNPDITNNADDGNLLSMGFGSYNANDIQQQQQQQAEDSSFVGIVMGGTPAAASDAAPWLVDDDNSNLSPTPQPSQLQSPPGQQNTTFDDDESYEKLGPTATYLQKHKVVPSNDEDDQMITSRAIYVETDLDNDDNNNNPADGNESDPLTATDESKQVDDNNDGDDNSIKISVNGDATETETTNDDHNDDPKSAATKQATQKKLLMGCIAFTLLLSLILGITLPLTLRKKKSTTTTTTTASSSLEESTSLPQQQQPPSSSLLHNFSIPSSPSFGRRLSLTSNGTRLVATSLSKLYVYDLRSLQYLGDATHHNNFHLPEKSEIADVRLADEGGGVAMVVVVVGGGQRGGDDAMVEKMTNLFYYEYEGTEWTSMTTADDDGPISSSSVPINGAAYATATDGTGTTVALSHDASVTIVHRSTETAETTPPSTHFVVTEDIGGFGHALSFAGDGSRLAVASAGGVVYVYEESDDGGGTRRWEMVGSEPIAPPPSDAGGGGAGWEGLSLSLSREGDYIAIGMVPMNAADGSSSQGLMGNCRVFRYTNDKWEAMKGGTAGGVAGRENDRLFGMMVKLSNDGKKVAVLGRAYARVYVLDVAQWSWTMVVEFEGSGGGEWKRMDMSGDGGYLVLGTGGDGIAEADDGVVEVYKIL